MKLILNIMKVAYLCSRDGGVRGVLDTIITGTGGCAAVTSLNPFGS